MKIIYKKGNLLDCEEQIILHGVNMRGVMGAGVAKAIKEKHPHAFKEYQRAFLQHGLKLGQVILVESNGKLICNAVTQQYYGREPNRVYVSYEAIKECVLRMNHFFDAPCYANWGKNPEERSIAMPKIGAGLAGGDWNIISRIIEEESTNFQPVVYEL